MTREEVIKGLESIHGVAVGDGAFYVTGCGMGDFNRLLKAAADALKGQEPISASITDSDGGMMHWWVCGACQAPINPEDNYCHECGRKVRWKKVTANA